jgi:hypothetical protein
MFPKNKGAKMTKIVICKQSGTVLHLEHCVLVDVDGLTDQDQEDLFEGGDGDAIELAVQLGKPIQSYESDLKIYLLSRLDQLSKEIKEVATEVEKWLVC